MRRAVIYARYSTDLQDERSIDDQSSFCRAFLAQRAFQEVGAYDDRALSGATVFGRSGLAAMMRAAENKQFDVLVVESYDRLSRNQADLPRIYQELTFLGIQLIGINDGGQPADTVAIGLRGLMGELYRIDGAKKVHRGMSGMARGGRYAGGRAYGYQPVPGEPGRRTVVEHEAEIVKSIFERYVEGWTPREIAQDLNRRKILPPRGSAWNASTINGSSQRANGIIRNTTYVGQIAWNRVRMTRDPQTGKRVSRPNPSEEWVVGEGRQFGIVSDELFAKANEIKRGKARAHPSSARKPKRLLSGLLKCACCGGGMSAAGKDKSGRDRIRCSRHKESGTCPRPHTHYLDNVEESVLILLKLELRKPEYIRTFLDTYQQERRRLAGDIIQQRARIERQLAEVGAELDRLTDMLIRGVGEIGRLDRISKEKQSDEAKLRAQLDALNEGALANVELHPAAINRYLQTVEDLHGIMVRNLKEGSGETGTILRELVESVIVHPPEKGAGGSIQIRGRLAALTGLPDVLLRTQSGGLVVAEEGSSTSRPENVDVSTNKVVVAERLQK